MSLILRTVVALVVLAAASDPPSRLTGGQRAIEVQAGDSLASLGARAGVEPRTLARDNGLATTARLKPGDRLMVDNRHIAPNGFTDGIVLNVPQRMLFVFEDGAPIRAFPVAVGRADWRTPLGSFDVAVRSSTPCGMYPSRFSGRWRAAAGESSQR